MKLFSEDSLGEAGKNPAESPENNLDELMQAKKLVPKDEKALAEFSERLNYLACQKRPTASMMPDKKMVAICVHDLLTAIVHEKEVDISELTENMRDHPDYSDEHMREALESIADLVKPAE